jgi:hypothetical protein
MNLRQRAFDLLEEWHAAREAAVVRPEHALVVVQELCLEDTGTGGMRATQKRTSKSFPPIRDMPRRFRPVDDIINFVGDVDPNWRKALELYCQHGSIRKAAKSLTRDESLHGRLTTSLWRQFDQGLAVLQAELVRRGL